MSSEQCFILVAGKNTKKCINETVSSINQCPAPCLRAGADRNVFKD